MPSIGLHLRPARRDLGDALHHVDGAAARPLHRINAMAPLIERADPQRHADGKDVLAAGGDALKDGDFLEGDGGGLADILGDGFGVYERAP